MSPSPKLTHLSPSDWLSQKPSPRTMAASITEWATRCVNIPGLMVQCIERENVSQCGLGETPSGATGESFRVVDIICEGETCPEVSGIVDQLSEGLKVTNLETLLPPDSRPLLMVNVHGRIIGEKRPNWTVRLDPNNPDTATPPLDGVETQHLLSRDEAKISEMLPRSRDWEAARQGDPAAIADYLSQTLKSWGLGVKVIVKIHQLEKANPEPTDPALDGAIRQSPLHEPEISNPVNPWSPENLNAKVQGDFTVSLETNYQPEALPPQKRLLVVCKSAYSPEPLSIGPPLGARLRELDLTGFKDAVIVGQVSGEKKPEWILRVDLTPAKKMLEDWARWGDVQAITKLLHQRLIETLPGSFAEDLQVSGVLKESTLHVFFSDPGFAIDRQVYGTESHKFNKEAVKASIAPVLESIAPQNIYGITIYGLRGDRGQTSNPSAFLKNRGSDRRKSLESDATPLWVDWLDLPASRHANLAPTPMELAKVGDLAALTFLLDRLLNPDLERKLNTGGIRIAIRQKADLLHVMVIAATCPSRKVGAKVAKFTASLNLPDVGGVRVYGRRSGKKQIQWRYGLDFQSRESEGDITPEFKVSEPESSNSSVDLLPHPGNLVIHPDVNSEDLQACLTTLPTVGANGRSPLRKKKEESPNRLLQGLILSGVFIQGNSTSNNNLTGAKLTIIWGLLGLLFTLQADWLLAELLQLRQYELEAGTISVSTAIDPYRRSPNSVNPTKQGRSLFRVSRLGNGQDQTSSKGSTDRDRVFNASSFTKPWDLEPASEPARSAKKFKYPSFNSEQMDRQLAIYAQYVATYGLPDVLVVGSSRALRGIDPALLRRGLPDRYSQLRIFNFGVNGATAQVVDSIVRELLSSEQLPRLIIWADGARAFNSGRSDRTFEFITNSVGYQDLKLGLRPTIVAPSVEEDSSLASLSLTLADRAKNGLSFTDGYQKLDRWLNEQLGSFSASYPQREELNEWLADSWRQQPGFLGKFGKVCENSQKNPDSACENSASVGENVLEAITTADRTSASHINGFLPINLKFDRVTYYEQYAFVAGDYDADYESFNLTGEQTDATIDLLSFLGQHQVSLVFVNMPLTEEYLDPIRLKYERLFQKYMLGLALQYGFVFRDFSQEWPNEHHYFSDPSHLNHLGAQRISERLSQDPLIPWPNAESKE